MYVSYMCFGLLGACVEKLKHYKPIIQIDATFLYEKYMGNFFIATSIDAYCHIFPFAFIVVDEESIVGLGFFMH